PCPECANVRFFPFPAPSGPVPNPPITPRPEPLGITPGLSAHHLFPWLATGHGKGAVALRLDFAMPGVGPASHSHLGPRNRRPSGINNNASRDHAPSQRESERSLAKSFLDIQILPCIHRGAIHVVCVLSEPP